MIEMQPFGDVIRIRMARTLFGWNLYYTAAYFLDGLLIDTGPPHVGADFFNQGHDLGIERIVNTHHHEDHVGADFLFERERGIRSLAHPRAIPRIADPPKRLPLYREVVWGVPKPAAADPVGEWVETPRRRLEVLYTPGHTDDHICLYDPETGYLFSGDLYLGVKVLVLRADEDILALMDSLRRVLQKPLSTLFCGSGKVVEAATEQLRLKLEFLEELQEKARRLRAQGWPLHRIRNRLLGREGFFQVVSFGEFSKLNLIRGFLQETTVEHTKAGPIG